VVKNPSTRSAMVYRIEVACCPRCNKEKALNSNNWVVDKRNWRNGGYRLHACKRCVNTETVRRRREKREKLRAEAELQADVSSIQADVSPVQADAYDADVFQRFLDTGE
jgi:hypothetical protein